MVRSKRSSSSSYQHLEDLNVRDDKHTRDKKRSRTSHKNASHGTITEKDSSDQNTTLVDSMMHRVRLEVQVTLPPVAIGSERKYAFRYIRQRLLSRYFPANADNSDENYDNETEISSVGAGECKGGALIAFKNLDFANGGVGEMKSPCYPHLFHFTLQCDAMVFRPQIGKTLYNVSGEDIIVKSCVMTHMELNVYGGVLKAFILSTSLHSAGLTFEYGALPPRNDEGEKIANSRRRSDSIQLHGTAKNPGVDTSDASSYLESVGYWVNPNMPDKAFSAGKALRSFVIDRFNDVNGFLVLEGKEPQLM